MQARPARTWPARARHVRLAVAVAALVVLAAPVAARAWPRFLLTRTERVWPYADVTPRVQTEIDAQVGIRVERTAAAELLFELYSTGDSEQVADEPAPLTTLGIVVRVATE